ncbi:NAD-dependent succinate-semialdehyde dehydrogenase [Marichromatium sp. AB32]|uniref:NAD-dependent succinate-semialdehyde dehydrogenase n=1 Tax=Marichromatium sp. AB32 TaxID=2483363 RepID=UPI000F3E3339|nr:NAD-dependent succinate-semialdehyde dehydrogenase [Marichromatium sp. AB32]RNE93825.1 NAD-dependent succinate-semialdehyde dehydrogenase [Marichromatium sp. AB32]
MPLRSIDPATGALHATLEPATAAMLEQALASASRAAGPWGTQPLATRVTLLRALAEGLRAERARLARLITDEMGKLIAEAEAEIDKCALVCDYYAEHAATQLADIPLASDASRSLLAHQPLGVVLAVMPWNFPFWQVFRCAAPALAAGNVVLLKHASNVPRCALAIADLFAAVDAPEGVFQTLLIDAETAEQVVADPRVRAVSLTGSERAGRRVAGIAGANLKKSLLELGGADACVILEDADLERAAEIGARSRFINAGQSCIAAKRFIVVEAVADDFAARLQSQVEALVPGDPRDPDTTLAPLARKDLRETLHQQVEQSRAAGAELRCGGQPLPGPGWFYAPTLLDRVGPGMPAYEDELFGPVATVIRVADETEALRVANDTRFGLGGSVWSTDIARAERFARAMACGAVFVNGLVKSDPRLPFGGIKDSGYGRELGAPGIAEFLNLKTLWIG